MLFFLLSTDHLETKLWFGNDIDYCAAMNYVGISAYRTGVRVMSFILMSNHVHFVLECTWIQAETFINFFKNQYSLYRRKQYGDKEFLRGNRVDIQEITLNGESLEKAIAYVQMNSVAARLCVHPTGYRWGTGNVFFNSDRSPGRPIGTFSARFVAKALHSRLPVNPEWLIGEGGYILPESYVAVTFVESLYKTPSRYQYFLDCSSKAKKNKDVLAPSFSDQLILTASLNLCRTLFRANSVDDLSPSQAVALVKELRRRFSSDVAQIARVTGITYKEIVRALENF